MEPRQLDVPVDGGNLRVLLWGTGENIAVAVHGITASAMSWQAVARRLPADWALAAPDLRGRGHSNELPGPFGLGQHVSDVAAVLAHLGGPPVLAGHSMGAYIALLTRDAHPDLARGLILVDGGLPFPLPEGIDVDATLNATLGPAVERLTQVFADEAAYVHFWRGHPALVQQWTQDVEDYVTYDLRPAADGAGLRSRAAEDAVRADGRDIMLAPGVGAALERLEDPTPLLTAPKGMFGVPPGLQPPELVEAWQQRVPRLKPVLVPDVNHYTILFAPAGAQTVADAITGRVNWSNKAD
jgi:lipase